MMDLNGRQLPPHLIDALRDHVARGPEQKPVSISDLKRRVRFVMPELEISDEELENLIARETYESSRRPVLFDGRDEGERGK